VNCVCFVKVIQGKIWYMNLILKINFLMLSLSENNAKTLNFNQLLIYCSTLTSRHSLTRSTSGICLVINAVHTRKVWLAYTWDTKANRMYHVKRNVQRRVLCPSRLYCLDLTVHNWKRQVALFCDKIGSRRDSLYVVSTHDVGNKN